MCLPFSSACDSTSLFCYRPRQKHVVVSNQLCCFISTRRSHSIQSGLLGQRQEKIGAVIRSPFAGAEETSWTVGQWKVMLLRVEAVRLENCLGLHQQMILLSSLASKKMPLRITREGWSSINIFADRVVPSLELFRNGNVFSVILVGEEPVTTAQ